MMSASTYKPPLSSHASRILIVLLSALVFYLLRSDTIIASKILPYRQVFRSFTSMAKVAPPLPIKLYSNKLCPFAARSRLALAEANADYEEVEIDLQNKPDWYLQLNPNGKVPAMDFGGNFVIESNVIAEFVADLFPQAHLRPEGNSAEAALKAAKMRLFIEIWNSKVQGSIFAPFFGPGDKDAPSKIVNALKNDVAPFFKESGGPYVLGQEFSMADVMTHSFVLRLVAWAKAGFYGEGLYEELQEIKEIKEWHDALLSRDSVQKTFDEELIVERMGKHLEAKKN